MRLLDLYCGGGGAGMGYALAGFDVTGVDMYPQTRYPFAFVQADAVDYVLAHSHEYDVIHASPPCQAHTALKGMWNAKPHADFLPQTREALQATGLPYVIENVPGAPMDVGLMLCGSMFGLRTSCGAVLRRHRLFESNRLIMSPGECDHKGVSLVVTGHSPTTWAQHSRRRTIGVYGDHTRDRTRNLIRETFTVDDAREAMGIDWLSMPGLSQAIPPAYTKWIGAYLVNS